MRKHNILCNTIGISDSGGITVLEKVLDELLSEKESHYIFICSHNEGINKIREKYLSKENIDFIFIKNNSYFYRLYYENIIFRKIIKNNSISLVYNFSGSVQFFLRVPQITKIQNLLFFSKKLDNIYIKKRMFYFWAKQVFLKRQMRKFMLRFSIYLEIQSSHVISCLSDFIKVNNKVFYIKSDIDVKDQSFRAPRQYDFAKKITFLYIIGPHFEHLHKNISDFTNMMVSLIDKNIDFEINITLTKEQLNSSSCWHSSLNSRTNFIGYVDNKKDINKLFCDNTILISTSIIETIGLHIVEGIKNGVITIAPNESYSQDVYGENMIKYELFNIGSLCDATLDLIREDVDHNIYIKSLQDDLKKSEKLKYQNILEIFDEVLNV